MQIVLHRDEPLKGALLLVGFPSRGLVGGVAAHFVIDDLKMRHIAGLYDANLPPTVAVRDGIAHSPIRFFASDARCGPDGGCDKLVVAVSDIPLPEGLLGDVAHHIVAWAKEQGVAQIVILEGVKGNDALQHRQHGAKRSRKEPRVRGIRSVSSDISFARYNVDVVHDAMLSSYAAAFLLAANELDADLVSFFIESRADSKDHEAAAALLRRVDPLLPNIDFDTNDLAKRSEELANDMRTTIRHSSREVAALRKPNEMMYA